MFQRTKVYTVHECQEKNEITDRIELVREGFSWLAFFFNILWLLYQRLWIPALAYFALLVGTEILGEVLHLSVVGISMLQLFLQAMLGFAAYDLKRWRLSRKGYSLIGVVTGETRYSAQRRYYDAIA